MIVGFKTKKALMKILEDNPGKISLDTRHGYYSYEGNYMVSIDDLSIPKEIKVSSYGTHDGDYTYTLKNKRGKRLGFITTHLDR